jgi:hypothetical protein
LFTLGSYLKITEAAHIMEQLYSTVKLMHYLWVGLHFFHKLANRVARWFIFKPKIPIWVNFERPWKGKCFAFYIF